MQLKDVWPRIVPDRIQTAPSNPNAFKVDVRVQDPELIMQWARHDLTAGGDYYRIASVHPLVGV